MVFCIPINIATATMEEIYETLCWPYVTVRAMLVFDAIGYSYPFSDLTELSEAHIHYPEHFVNKFDYEQNLILHPQDERPSVQKEQLDQLGKEPFHNC